MWQSVVVCGTTGPLVDHLVTTSRPLLQPMKISAVLHASLMPLFWRRMMVIVSDDDCCCSPKMQQTFGPGALQSCPTQSCQEVFVCWDIKFKYTNTLQSCPTFIFKFVNNTVGTWNTSTWQIALLCLLSVDVDN